MKTKIFLLCAMLAACGTTQPSVFYTLDSGDIPAPMNQKADNVLIAVEPVSVPAALSRPQIVLRDKNGLNATLSEFHRWIETPADAIPDILARAIDEAAGRPIAKPVPVVNTSYPYKLIVDIVRFDAILDKAAVLDVWWTFTTQDDVIVSRNHVVMTEPVGPTYADAVRGEQLLIERLGRDIGAAAKKTFKGK